MRSTWLIIAISFLSFLAQVVVAAKAGNYTAVSIPGFAGYRGITGAFGCVDITDNVILRFAALTPSGDIEVYNSPTPYIISFNSNDTKGIFTDESCLVLLNQLLNPDLTVQGGQGLPNNYGPESQFGINSMPTPSPSTSQASVPVVTSPSQPSTSSAATTSMIIITVMNTSTSHVNDDGPETSPAVSTVTITADKGNGGAQLMPTLSSSACLVVLAVHFVVIAAFL